MPTEGLGPSQGPGMRWRVSDQEVPGQLCALGAPPGAGPGRERQVSEAGLEGPRRAGESLETPGGKNRTPREKEGAPADSRPQCSGSKVRG